MLSFGVGLLVAGSYWCWLLRLAGRIESREQYEARQRRVARRGFGRAGYFTQLSMQRYRHPVLVWTPAVVALGLGTALVVAAVVR